MRRLCPVEIATILIALAGCSDAGQAPPFTPTVIGRLEDSNIREASGLARSHVHENLLWVINDNGNEEWVHAINPRGARLGEFDLKKSNNQDWEDLASFQMDGKAYLLIADIGDNDARRETRTLYVVEEPRAAKNEKAPVD